MLDDLFALWRDSGKVFGVYSRPKTISGRATLNLSIADAMLTALGDPR